jgi:hypothetical protein
MWISGGPSWWYDAFESLGGEVAVVAFLDDAGEARWRRGGLGLWRSSARASAVARVGREGWKGRPGGDLAAGDVEGAGEREPVGSSSAWSAGSAMNWRMASG